MKGKRIIVSTVITAVILVIALVFTPVSLSVEGFASDQTSISQADVDAYPSRPIEVVVPAGAGGDTDLGARILSQYVGEELGRPMVVTNIAGAGGSTGSREVVEADPDGYQVLFFHNSMLISYLYGMSDFNHHDLKIAAISLFDYGDTWIVNANADFQTAQELAEASRQQQGELSFATEIGGYTHLQMLAYEDATGAEFRLVDVGGASDKVVALLGGQVDVVPTAYGVTADYIDSGDFSSVGLLSEQTSELYDQTPTFIDQDIDIGFEKFFFFAFPKETPDEIVDKFSEAVKEVVENNEEYQERAAGYYTIPEYMPREEAMEYMDEINDYYDGLINRLERQAE